MDTLIRLHFRSVLLAFGIGLALCRADGQAPGAIDDLSRLDEGAVRARWQPMRGSDPVSVVTRDGAKAMRLPCRFAGNPVERASWDRKGPLLDLSACSGVQFQFHCPDVSPVSYFSIYFESGQGWYTAPFYPEQAGWNTIVVDKADARIEGRPGGWDAIQTIRISAWRGGETDTEMFVGDLRPVGTLGQDALVAILRGDSVAGTQPGEGRSAVQYAANLADLLHEVRVGCVTLSDTNVTASELRKARLVVLPHNPTLPESTEQALVKYLDGGGRLLAFFALTPRLRAAAKIEAGPFVKAPRPGYFATLVFAEGALPGAPARVSQESWNIIESRPVPGASRVVARWCDANGQFTGHNAIVASSNAVVMSHVLLLDDRANKGRMLLAMAGHLAPAIWQQSAQSALDGIGRVAGFRAYDEAAREIARQGGSIPTVAALLEEVSRLRAAALEARASARFAECRDRAAEARRKLLEAFCVAQRPAAGEFRAFWCHSAFGVSGMDWDGAVERLAENGFTAVIPNMVWGGVAYYPSQVLPVAPEVERTGDPVARCLEACRKHSLGIHIWKVNWNLGRAPKEFVARLRGEGRLQADSSGLEEPWLCPSHPANRQLEIDSMVEVVRRYDVDGIHFDYIRYPDGDHCFCAGCAERFRRSSGLALADWPRDVLTPGAARQTWLDWRRDNITAVVRAVNEQARAVRPDIKVSAAVFSNWTTDRDNIGQDWKLWCDRGYVDFVCPMDYTESDLQFQSMVRRQKEWAGKVPCYPGIGASTARAGFGADRVIGQIDITRRHGTGGFVVFNYGANEARDLVPMLGKGITRKESR